MHSAFPKLKFSLAHDALIHFFHNQYWTDDELDSIHNFFISHHSDNIRKLRLRLLSDDNNDMIVAAVLADSSSEQKIFLYDKYFRHFSFVKIGMKLHIHPNGLQRWRDKLLSDIASLLEYNLPLPDIFSRNKVEALVFVLERTICFYEKFGGFDYDFLCHLKINLHRYQNLLFAIKHFLYSDSDHISVKIIRMKILYPSITSDELQNSIGVSHTTVEHYFRLFQHQFFPQPPQ